MYILFNYFFVQKINHFEIPIKRSFVVIQTITAAIAALNRLNGGVNLKIGRTRKKARFVMRTLKQGATLKGLISEK